MVFYGYVWHREGERLKLIWRRFELCMKYTLFFESLQRTVDINLFCFMSILVYFSQFLIQVAHDAEY